jgi:hypothetical protein
MNPQQKSADIYHYDVQVGHWSVRVLGRNTAEAIEHARKRLCDDMPRLWDVITRLGVDRFHVQQVG